MSGSRVTSRSGRLRRGVRLDPVPGAQHPDQLRIRHPAEPVLLPRGGIGGQRQASAPGHHIQRQPGPNPPAGLDNSPGNSRAEPGIPGPRRPVDAAFSASISSAAAAAIPASSPGVSSSSPGGGGPSGSGHSSSSNGSSSSAAS
jgi:hypothetical protein